MRPNSPGRLGDADAAAYCGDGTARGVADRLALAAAPVFAAMALVTAVFGDGAGICSLMPASPFNGMVSMYLLMSVFHAPPLVRLAIARRRRLLWVTRGKVTV